MAPQNGKKREFSAAELAMLDDIGVGRIGQLPLEDRGAVPRGNAAVNSLETGRTGVNNKWNQAIAGGLFDDEDAAVVAGQEQLANGQLARMRRAADLSYMAVNRGYDYNDRRIRRNNNDQVPPRAQFFRGDRGPAKGGLAHSGDGPVQLRGAMPNSRHAPEPISVPKANMQRRAEPSRAAMLPPIGASAHGWDQVASARPRPPDSTRTPAEPTPVPKESSASQDGVQMPPVAAIFEIPDGYSILFKAQVAFASPAFPNRTAEYPGTVYLVAGPAATDDQIVLHINEGSMEDVRRATNEYVDYLSDSDRLILQFKDESGHITWFVLLFRQRNTMSSFVDALRNLVNRLKEPKPSVQATTQKTTSVVDTTTPSIESPHPKDITKVVESHQKDTTKALPIVVVEDIVTWAMNIVSFIREAGPVELSGGDALPGIIRGASAAVLIEKHPDFSRLDPKQRVAFVDDVCAPQVYERFQRRMLENFAGKQPVHAASSTEAHTKYSPDAQETASPGFQRPKYTIQELMQLQQNVVEPPSWLTELRYLPEMNLQNRELVQEIIGQARGDQSAHLAVQTVSDCTARHALPATPSKPAHSLDGNDSPGREQGGGSSRGTDAAAPQTAPVLSVRSPRITVNAPVEATHPEEPLISIYGEMNGLNASIHNSNGVNLLGKSTGEFTGALSKNKSHLQDLMLIDRDENFEDIRANDPEVAEIADRFARVHFSDDQPS